MKKLVLPVAVFLALSPLVASAQVSVGISIGLPVAPPLVVVQPGIQVVEGFHEEVFFQGGWYWCRRPDGWYRSRSPQARFAWIDVHRVPPALVRFPVGHYRNWHHDAPRGGEHGAARPEHHRQEERRREEGEHHRQEERHRAEGEHEHR
jgi:hypothetical protein